MADLQAELQRFLTARFGADVKDAFVSCIQKIHAENLDVAALEESMRTAAAEVASAKSELMEELRITEDELNTAFTDAVREITSKTNTATSTANNASKTADDAKIIARSAESNASAALATAANARDEASNAAGDAELAMLATQQVQTAYKTMELLISGKVDGAFVENGYLYLTSNNEVVAGPLGPFSGGGGAGGSTGNNAVLSVSNASGWLSKSVAYGGTCPVTITWSSLEDGLSTGNGVMKLTVNGVVKAMFDINQGTVTKDISSYLSAGVNAVRVTVSDVYENSRTINFSINAVDISLSSTFDASVPFTGNITFTYVPTGNVQKEVHIILDGEEIETVNTSSSGRQMSFTIAAQSHGGHSLEAYFTTTIDGTTVESNHLYYEFISLESLNNTPVIVSSFKQDTVAQYTTLAIPYTVYDPASLTTAISLRVNGNVVSQQTVDRTQQLWTYRVDTVGVLALEISCGSAAKTIGLTVTPSDITVEAENDSLTLHLSSYGRSNNEDNPSVWETDDVSVQFSNFNFISDGWLLDDENITVLRVSGDARLDIPVQPFAQDFRTSGKTIELEFSTRDVMNYDAVVLSCMSGGRGIQLTPQMATLQSEQSRIFTQYKEDEHVRVAFVVGKRSEHCLIYCYINGVMSGVVQYPTDDDFAQAAPVNITVGSNEATIDLYNIRIYDNSLTRQQVLNNWIADTQIVENMLSRYSRNNVFDAYSNIVIAQLPADLPYLILEASELPQYKGDKKTVSGSYVDPTNPARSFAFDNAQIDVQGTSSATYARKNYKVKFAGGFIKPDGNTAETYAMRSNAIPTDTFTFKADVASSEGANNVELARLYNDACPYKTAYQKEDSRVRQGIDGFPIVIFWYDGNNTTFMGKYNFNNDKATGEVFGFTEGDESWEVRNNTSDRVLWKSDDYEGTEWLNDFEARYPEGSTDATQLNRLATWLKSTDQSAATGRGLSVDRTYEGVLYTHDTPEYRLAKFKAELGNYLEKDAVLFYYLFTELFLMVDSRAKNMFPSIMAGSKWFSLPYDFDTAIGINNEGSLTFSYHLEDIDHTDSGADVYNGQQSVLWVNVRQAFFNELKAMYQELRSKRVLTFEDTERRFEEHQAKWPEAVFNEDAYYKYLAPLEETNTASYLSMLQGSKAEQRKWWLYNRFRYIDSKYNAGDALTDVVTLRGYAKSDIAITPYADVYATIKYGSYLVQQRAFRNREYVLACPMDNVNDTEIYVYSASQLKSIGDVSGLMVGYADFSNATRLQMLKIGDGSESYSNPNLETLYLGNNRLLRTLDVRNCPNLTQAVDVTGCTNLEHAYFEGSSITGLVLPNGGFLKTLHLPDTMTNLTLRNQTSLTDFVFPSCENLSTLRLENVSDAVDVRAILEATPAGARVRVVGFDWIAESAEEILEFYDFLDTMRGMDENGNNTDKAQLSGSFTLDSLTGNQLVEMQERYPHIEIKYNQVHSDIFFYDDSGENLLYTKTIYGGADASYSGSTPTKVSTAQYSYKFSGWSLTPGGSANNNALKAITVDRNVYAAFTSTVRTYTVYFYNGNTLMQKNENIAYGRSVYYSGQTPVKSGVAKPEDWQFVGWEPNANSITGTTYCYAQYRYIGYAYSALIDRSLKDEYVNDEVTSIGAYAFADCKSLISASFASATSIGRYAFSNASELKSFSAPLVTTIEENAFLSCSKLTAIHMPKAATVGNSVFSSCTALTHIDLPEAVTISYSAFSGCQKLATVNLPKITSLGHYAFNNCKVLTTLDCPELTSCGNQTFSLCAGLTSINMPKLKNMDSFSFSNCSKLTSVNLPELTAISASGFNGCTVMHTADFSKVTTIAANSFKNCAALTALILRSDAMATLANINAFDGTPIATGTGYIYVPDALLAAYKANSAWITYADQIRAIEDYSETIGG